MKKLGQVNLHVNLNFRVLLVIYVTLHHLIYHNDFHNKIVHPKDYQIVMNPPSAIHHCRSNAKSYVYAFFVSTVILNYMQGCIL